MKLTLSPSHRALQVFILLCQGLLASTTIQFKGNLVTNETVSVAPGVNVTLLCSDDANHAFWQTDGQNVTASNTSSVHQQLSPASALLTLTSTKASHSGLYYCTVDELRWTYVQLTVDSSDVPAKVDAVALIGLASVGRAGLRVIWSPVPQQGFASNSYIVCYNTSPRGVNAPYPDSTCKTVPIVTELTVLSLEKATTYYVWVAVKYSRSMITGPFSDRVNTTTFNVPHKPHRPTLTNTVRSGKPAIIVEWIAPESDSPVIGVHVLFRKGDSLLESVRESRGATSGEARLNDLAPGTLYVVRIRAYSSLGPGLYSNTATIVTADAPASVEDFTITPLRAENGSLYLNMTWGAPQSDAPVARYQAQHRTLQYPYWGRTFSIPSSDRFHLRSVQEGSDHEIRLQAVSSIGEGNFSVASALLPAIGVAQSRAVNSTSIELHWNSTRADHYTVYYTELDTRPTPTFAVETGNRTFLTIGSLQPFTSYSLRVSAWNVLGSINATVDSRISLVTTAQAEPSVAPANVKRYKVGTTWIYLAWDTLFSEPANGIVVFYTIQLLSQAGIARGTNEQENSTTVCCKRVWTYDVTQLSFMSRRSFNLTGLTPATEYTASVAASTVAGRGPFSLGLLVQTSKVVEDHTGRQTAVVVGSVLGGVLLLAVLLFIGFLLAMVATKVCRMLYGNLGWYDMQETTGPPKKSPNAFQKSPVRVRDVHKKASENVYEEIASPPSVVETQA